MKRLTIWLAILLMAMCVVPQDREHYIRLGDLMKPKMNGFAVALDQAVNTTSSPTHVGLTLSGLTASTVVYSNASKAITSLANSAGYLYNNGSGTLSWGTVDLSAYLPKMAARF